VECYLAGHAKASYWRAEHGKLFFAEVGDFGIAYRGDVAAGDEELHNFCAVASELGPARGRRGILLEAADTLAGHVEIDLGELVFCGVLYCVGIVAEGDTLFAFEQDLPPHGEQRIIQF
jgi:hypothetical protein